jgi:hypothetical protein
MPGFNPKLKVAKRQAFARTSGHPSSSPSQIWDLPQNFPATLKIGGFEKSCGGREYVVLFAGWHPEINTPCTYLTQRFPMNLKFGNSG